MSKISKAREGPKKKHLDQNRGPKLKKHSKAVICVRGLFKMNVFLINLKQILGPKKKGAKNVRGVHRIGLRWLWAEKKGVRPTMGTKSEKCKKTLEGYAD